VAKTWLMAVAMLALVGCGTSASTTTLTPISSAIEPSTAPAPATATTAEDAGHPLAGEEAWIAYQTNKGGSEGVWLIHPDGSEDHEVALDVPGEHLHPDWSPDGTRLVITSRTAVDELYELDDATDTSRTLWPCEGECVGDDEAVWSPVGEQIAFVRAQTPFVDEVPSCLLMVGDPVTGVVGQITQAKSCWDRETFPHWSHDATRIAYYRGVYQGNTTLSTALYVLDVVSGTETKLTDDALFAGDSDWSADDEWIVFSTYPLNDFQCCQISNLYRIHPDGTGGLSS